MQNQSYTKINPIIIIAIVLELLFIILVIATLNSILNSEQDTPKIAIDNYSQVENSIELEGNISNNLKKDILGRAIYRTVSMNYSGNLKNSGAKIREGSMRSLYLNDYDFQYMNFLIDLPDIQQTYRVIYRQGGSKTPEGLLSIDEYNAIVLCPREEDLIYEAFDCEDGFGSTAIDSILKTLIRYSEFEGFAVNPVIDMKTGNIDTIEIVMESDDEKQQEAAVNQVKEFLESVGMNPDDYTYTVGQEFSHYDDLY